MPPKSGSKKAPSTPSDAAENAKQTKFKLPKELIARPLTLNKSYRNACTVVVHPKVLKGLEISPGSLCVVSKLGMNGILALAEAGSEETQDANVILISGPLRSVTGLLLGDRLEIKKAPTQPPYATAVTIGTSTGDVITDLSERKKVEKLLDECGIAMPGLIIRDFDIGREGKKVDVVVVSTQDETLPDISTLSLESQNVTGSIYASPPVLFRRGTTKVIFSDVKSPHPRYGLPKSISYSDVGGLDKEIELLKNTIILPLQHPTLFTDFGISPPRGILLHGPSGTGKTMLLKCIANASDAHVLVINGPSIVSKYLGETEGTLRDIFKEAKKYQPSIIFIDELDSLAPNRSSDDTGEVESRVVATLLTLMDDMGSSGKTILIAATNRIAGTDPSLRRPGRFDQEVEIGIPDVSGRLDILTKQFANMSSERHSLTDEDIKTIASKTHGYVGADLSALCRESVMRTIQRGMSGSLLGDVSSLKVTLEDVENAMLDIRPSAMREIFLEMPKVRWSDIGGQEELKQKFREMIQLPLETPDSFVRLGVSAPKGVLLYGPPGCSKTLTAKALATESGVNFLAVKGPEIFNKYVGESERAIREIFRKARSAAPSIIFFDEIDAISAVRGSSSSAVSNHVLTSLLNEIDGVEELHGVVIIAATNRPDEIDPALLRPGRLDRHIYVAPPDFNARLQILKNSTKKFQLEETKVDLEELARKTEGFSGAEVVLLCQEAGLAAIMENFSASNVEDRHFEKALQGMTKGITEEMLEYFENYQKNGIA